MELVYFSEQTFPKPVSGGAKRAARIAFVKNGVISINKSAADLIGLKSGAKVTLAQDKKEPENWYLFIDPNGFEVRVSKSKGFIFNHRSLQRAFIQCFGKDENVSHKFLIAGKPTEMKDSKTKYWGILVS
jgi:hypothetical protein